MSLGDWFNDPGETTEEHFPGIQRLRSMNADELAELTGLVGVSAHAQRQALGDAIGRTRWTEFDAEIAARAGTPPLQNWDAISDVLWPEWVWTASPEGPAD